MPEKNELTAVILAGGKSSRMKQDKGLIVLYGKMMIEHVIEKVKEITCNIIIITKNPTYRRFGYPCFSDIYPDAGPLGGIYTGLVHSATEKNLVVGCDTPFLSVAVLNALKNKSLDEDVLVTVQQGKAEPLFAIYDRKCIPHFKERIKKRKLKIIDAIQELKTGIMNIDKEKWITKNEFANINTPEELNKYILLKTKPVDNEQ